MRYVSILIFLLSLLSCSQQAESINDDFTKLCFLGTGDTLLLRFKNQNCGEWGGDVQNVYVYKQFKDGKSKILLDVNELNMNCDSIEKYFNHPLDTKFEIKKVQADSKKIKLISAAIEELINLKMNFNAENGFSNSGCISRIATSSKTFNVQIYPSPKWNAFQKLFGMLKLHRNNKGKY
jgi:hypothetical protein